MKTQHLTQVNAIGLNAEGSQQLSNMLNQLLANLQLHYQNMRALHWSIRGANFFELHAKFEELYTDAQLKVDEVAERVLTLGGIPMHTLSDYVAISSLQAIQNVSEDRPAVQATLNDLAALLKQERAVLTHAAELGDEGTVTLISDFIALHEKNAWMLSAWLDNRN